MNYDEWFLDGSKLPKSLPKQRVKELLILCNEGNLDAREELIKNNIRLVLYQVSNSFSKVDYDKKELVSIGIIGLIKAIDTFDISKDIEFSTYASKCINNEIFMFLRQLKKSKLDDSLDSPINTNKNDTDEEMSLLDVIASDIDITEECERKDTNKVIRECIESLQYREKEVIKLYFGFYNDKIYSQLEISDILNLSQSYISRIITRSLKMIKNELISKGIIEAHNDKKVIVKSNPSKNNKKGKIRTSMKTLQSIYEYFNDFRCEEIDYVISKLNENDYSLLIKRYGSDLINPTRTNLSKKDTNRFYGALIPKIRRKLIKNRSLGTKIEAKPKEELSIQKQDMTKKDEINILSVLKTPSFTQMLNVLSVKEAIIIALRLGYVDNKYFSTKSIADFLGIEEKEVIETVKKVLLLYKDGINEFIDKVINNETMENGQYRVLRID